MNISYKSQDFPSKQKCFGCGACEQACTHNAIIMKEDEEGFIYPFVDCSKCVECGLCEAVCPYDHTPSMHNSEQTVFAGYLYDSKILDRSTSGGAFSAIVDLWCEDNYVIFGAKSFGLDVKHSYISNKKDIDVFRKSKYSQSIIGKSYLQTKQFLKKGKNVLFSGTPCQIAGLRAFLKNREYNGRLLTVEVICEGVPSPHYLRKAVEHLKKKGKLVNHINYRCKDGRRWDYEVMEFIYTENTEKHSYKIDRFFNPFWSIWLQHLMSRPSCYSCPFATKNRIADITLGDFWGVLDIAPELYGNNRGCSIVIFNSSKTEEIKRNLPRLMYGHEVSFSKVSKYQYPLNAPISYNPLRTCFMKDLAESDYSHIRKKWNIRASRKFLIKHYLFRKNQKAFINNIKKLLVGLLK